MSAKTTKRIVAMVAPLLIIALMLTAWVIASANTRLTHARELTNRNSVIIDDVEVSGSKEIGRSNTSQCNRFGIFTEQTCEVAETRIYSVGKSYQQEMTTKLAANGWNSDLGGQSDYFRSPSGSGDPSILAQVGAVRYANDGKSGKALHQTLLAYIYKRVPKNNNGHFQNTGIQYSSSLSTKLENEISNGAQIVVVVAYHQFTSWW